jgi:hypothetical protein
MPSVDGDRLMDFLPMAQPAAVDIFPVRLCPYLPNHLVFGIAFTLSTGKRRRPCAGLVTAAISRNERYHEFYAVFFLVQTIVISFLIFPTLV